MGARIRRRVGSRPIGERKKSVTFEEINATQASVTISTSPLEYDSLSRRQETVKDRSALNARTPSINNHLSCMFPKIHKVIGGTSIIEEYVVNLNLENSQKKRVELHVHIPEAQAMSDDPRIGLTELQRSDATRRSGMVDAREISNGNVRTIDKNVERAKTL